MDFPYRITAQPTPNLRIIVTIIKIDCLGLFVEKFTGESPQIQFRIFPTLHIYTAKGNIFIMSTHIATFRNNVANILIPIMKIKQHVLIAQYTQLTMERAR